VRQRPVRYALFVLSLATAASADAGPRARGQCTLVRILANGEEVRSTVSDRSTVAVSRSRRAASAASASSRGSARSAVSVSSSSSGGRSSATAVSSYTDEDGRTVTTRRDGRGCTITVDERDLIGEE